MWSNKIHAESLIGKLVPANDKQRSAIEVAKRMIWWLYRSLKEYKLAPSQEQAQVLRHLFDRIFKRRLSITISDGAWAWGPKSHPSATLPAPA